MPEKKKYKIIIAAGGTGGHVFPAIALAKKFKSDGHKTVIVATGNDLEKKIFEDHDIENIFFESKLKDQSTFSKFLSAMGFSLLSLDDDKGIAKFVKEFTPQLILGMGGYASFDVLQSGKLCATIDDNGDGIFMPEDINEPYIAIHEQNAKAGRANRVIAVSTARGIIEGLEGAFDWKTTFFLLSTDDHVFLGNPVRNEILNINRKVRSFKEYSKSPRILVLGGSQGARSVNYAIPEVIKQLSKEMNIEVMHQTGELDYEEICQMYKENELCIKVFPFIKDMAEAYEWADLVIGRSGAMTVAELSAIGMPSILIPYPHATDNHQWFNAQFIAKKGGAEVILDKDLKLDILVKAIKKIFLQEGILSEMSEATFDETFVNATKNIAQFCYKKIEQLPLKNIKGYM
jgi:UDP-N-acetylglucosamine--N-acetylmuramyl-(pentapeptide) pyrophosphoryl-undecaprenol N-acetylglucosamine transferase